MYNKKMNDKKMLINNSNKMNDKNEKKCMIKKMVMNNPNRMNGKW